MPPILGPIDGIVWLASGVACAVVLLDIAGRCYFWQRNKRRHEVKHRTTQTSSTGYDVTDGIVRREIGCHLGASLPPDTAGGIEQKEVIRFLCFGSLGTGETLHMAQHEKSPIWMQFPEEKSRV
ncbi:hypothetical protein LSH36_241g06022 [Paralvinella palmiformis]|uniref:Uncharacterized protein n=1 Tax=Paralvinella palmiformis TaxID=53620 RepID=A0AAD9JNS3_9ANNE|nr:hypothetical protein LSH36_241g06022 [Paralvinella palmiformis]